MAEDDTVGTAVVKLVMLCEAAVDVVLGSADAIVDPGCRLVNAWAADAK